MFVNPESCVFYLYYGFAVLCKCVTLPHNKQQLIQEDHIPGLNCCIVSLVYLTVKRDVCIWLRIMNWELLWCYHSIFLVWQRDFTKRLQSSQLLLFIHHAYSDNGMDEGSDVWPTLRECSVLGWWGCSKCHHFCKKVKVKSTLVQALRLCTRHTAHRGSRGIVLPFHDYGTRRGWGVSVMPWPLFTPGKKPVPIVQEAGWAPGPVWTGAENLVSRGQLVL